MSRVAGDRDVPLGTPNSPIKAHQTNVRKRAAPAHHSHSDTAGNRTGGFYPGGTIPRGVINPSLIYNPDYSKAARPVSFGMRVRNCMTFLLMTSFPISIFLIPAWLKAPEYPRVVVSMATTPARLLHLQLSLESLLLDQSLSPSVVYLIVPHQTQDGDEGPHSWTMPAYLERLQLQTQLEILLLKSDHGSLNRIVYALEQEELSTTTADSPQQNKEEDTFRDETRLILVDEHYQYPRGMIQNMVDESWQFPNDVLSGVGGNLRSQFRQVKRLYLSADKVHGKHLADDKFPNVILQTATSDELTEWKVPAAVDVLESFTGLVFRTGLIPLIHIQQMLQLLEKGIQNDPFTGESSSLILDPSIGDLLWSGMLQAQNITQRVVPLIPGGVESLPKRIHVDESTNRTSAQSVDQERMNNPRSLSSRSWMVSARLLQQRLSIWQTYRFVDVGAWSKVQWEAVECEGRFEPDCTGTMCLPNLEHCPKAASHLQEWNDVVASTTVGSTN